MGKLFVMVFALAPAPDLLDILNFYVVRNKSTEYSKKLNSKINRSIELIAKLPLTGVKSGKETDT